MTTLIVELCDGFQFEGTSFKDILSEMNHYRVMEQERMDDIDFFINHYRDWIVDEGMIMVSDREDDE